MAYRGFAYLYDELNAAADYDALCAQLTRELKDNNILDGIVADLGCGTGEVSLRLAAAGYDMLSVDASEDMLSVFREKLAGEDILLLCQRLEELDLFGTIRAAVSTFDTLNHLPPDALRAAVGKVSLFMEPGGVFLFDANTPYKHRQVLAGNQFTYEDEGLTCRWQNRLLAELPAVEIAVRASEDGEELFHEQFLEYEYDLPFWENLLGDSGFTLLSVRDGESFAPLGETSQRFLFSARKRG